MEFIKDIREPKVVKLEEYTVTLSFRIDENDLVIDSQQFTEQDLRDKLAEANKPAEVEDSENFTNHEY